MAELGTAQIANAWPIFAAQGALTEVIYTHHSAGTLNITTGAMTTTSTDTTLLGLLSRYRHQQIDGVRVLAGDRRFHIPKASVEVAPRVDNIVTIDTVPWRIVSMIDSGNGGLWEWQLREATGAQVRI